MHPRLRTVTAPPARCECGTRGRGLFWVERQYPHVEVKLAAQLFADASDIDAFGKITKQRRIDLLRKPKVHAYQSF